MRARLALACALQLWLASIALAAGGGPPANEVLAQARSLVDDYYGERSNLEQAAGLISGLLKQPQPPSDAFVQAARITLKGGHIVSDRFEPNTETLAAYFIDRALTADPDNVRAYSLKAQVLMIRERDLPAAYAALQAGLSRQSSYPWLHLGLASYHEKTHDYRAAVAEYALVIQGGCSNSDSDQRRAFTSALVNVSFLMNQQDALTRRYAKDADQCRHPSDAWTLGGFAQLFNQEALFDDALVYARKALRVMNYGIARKELAMALYGKAAELSAAGKDPSGLLSEARAMRFPPEQVVGWFAESKSEAHIYVQPVSDLLRKSN